MGYDLVFGNCLGFARDLVQRVTTKPEQALAIPDPVWFAGSGYTPP